MNRKRIKAICSGIIERKRDLRWGCEGRVDPVAIDQFDRMQLDTFNFSRLCVYRGTPLWKHHIERGIIDDARGWYPYFKCADIDPSCPANP